MINEKSSLLLRCYLPSRVEEALTAILNKTSRDVKFLTLPLQKVYCRAIDLLYFHKVVKQEGDLNQQLLIFYYHLGKQNLVFFISSDSRKGNSSL